MATSLSKLLLLLASNLRILKTHSISVLILIHVPSQPKKDLKLKDQGKVAFIPYITAGDPDLSTTAQALKMLNSYSFSRSFARGTNFNAIMSMLKEVVPQLLVPLFYFRTSTRFLSMVLTRSCMDVGVHGLVVPDAPFEATKTTGIPKFFQGRPFVIPFLTTSAVSVGIGAWFSDLMDEDEARTNPNITSFADVSRELVAMKRCINHTMQNSLAEIREMIAGLAIGGAQRVFVLTN
ncbi:hypothetical protein COP2_048414 [Malus domestica]